MTSSNRRRRAKQDCHLLNDDGMVACNPRDREAAHRAEHGDLKTTDDPNAVTCKKCQRVLRRSGGE